MTQQCCGDLKRVNAATARCAIHVDVTSVLSTVTIYPFDLDTWHHRLDCTLTRGLDQFKDDLLTYRLQRLDWHIPWSERRDFVQNR
ncbi:hypothetical protein SCLCIDRAFT_31798 [Scleroderma citrinum Foug A]|uniref:Uncharacterized protein n=1 Tax=Scleroderma citrinum Foug A TaxID=1036808 RepID=A0A0C2YVB2_9AGAM|nr:hypothetical protein SCLCIDRAFT_31798 [Scleroderma citrinum Foug A]